MNIPGISGAARRLGPIILLAVAFSGSTVEGQSVSIDEGRFAIYRNGQRIGTESFWIRGTGSGAEARTIAKGEISLDLPIGRREIALALETRGTEMVLSAYEVKVSGDQQEEFAGRVSGRRFGARIVTSRGEQAREFPAAPEALILDQEVAHQYFFIGRLHARAPLVVPVISPRDRRHTRVRISVVGMESVVVGGLRMDARHVRIDDQDGAEAHVWVSPGDHVMRVEIPGTGYAAEREVPPTGGSPGNQTS